MMSHETKSVLVLLATGKMGSGVCNALVEARRNYRIFGTTRHASHPALAQKGVTPIEFTYGSKESIRNALHVSEASIVVVVTELIHIAKEPEVEVLKWIMLKSFLMLARKGTCLM